MPSRWLCLGIFLFWLIVNGWLLWHDLLPRLLPGQTPGYTPELVEEAKTPRPPVTWSVSLNDKEVAKAQIRIVHPHHDLYEQIAALTPKDPSKSIPSGNFQINRIESTYRVNAAGDLLGVDAKVDARLATTPIMWRIHGLIKSGRLTPRLQAEAPHSVLAGKRLEFELGTVESLGGGAVIMPLHPVNRMRGLTPGQTWHVYVLDPLGASGGKLPGLDADLTPALARVRSEEESFSSVRQQDVACLVVDYEGDYLKVSTWVAQRDGLVMCQEVTRGTTHWTLIRE